MKNNAINSLVCQFNKQIIMLRISKAVKSKITAYCIKSFKFVFSNDKKSLYIMISFLDYISYKYTGLEFISNLVFILSILINALFFYIKN